MVIDAPDEVLSLLPLVLLLSLLPLLPEVLELPWADEVCVPDSTVVEAERPVVTLPVLEAVLSAEAGEVAPSVTSPVLLATVFVLSMTK